MTISQPSSHAGYSIPELGFRAIFLLYLGSWLLPVFKSLPLTPHESLYTYVWFLFGLIVFPRVFRSREVLFTVSFLLLHVLYVAMGNYAGFNGKHKTLTDVFVMYCYPTSLFVYFFKSFPLSNIRFFAPIVLALLAITSVTTILAIFQFPEASRALAGNDNQEEIMLLLSMNVGGYDFIYVQALVGPLLIYFYKKTRNVKWLVLFLLAGGVVFYAQFTAAVILFLVNVAFTSLLLLGLNFRKYLLCLTLFAASFFFIKGQLVEILRGVSQYFSSFDSVQMKVNEVIMSLEGQSLAGTSLEAYNVRYKMSLEAFLRSPLFGGNSGGGHHYWIDALALYGIVGMILLMLVFRNFIRGIITYPLFSRTEKNLLMHATIMFFAIGLNKNIILSMPVILFVIYPLLLLRYGDYFRYSVGTTKTAFDFVRPKISNASNSESIIG